LDDKHGEGEREDSHDSSGAEDQSSLSKSSASRRALLAYDFGYLDITALINVLTGITQGFHLADKTWEDQICWIKSQNEGKYAIEDQDNGCVIEFHDMRALGNVDRSMLSDEHPGLSLVFQSISSSIYCCRRISVLYPVRRRKT